MVGKVTAKKRLEENRKNAELGRAAAAQMNEMKRKLARKYNLTITHFQPSHILKTLETLGLDRSAVPALLLKNVPRAFPLFAPETPEPPRSPQPPQPTPQFANGADKPLAAKTHPQHVIIMKLLDTLDNTEINPDVAERTLKILEKIIFK